MTHAELTTTIRNLKDLRNLAEQLQAEITAAEDAIKAEMTAQEADEISIFDEVAGYAHKIRWTTYTASRLDGAALKKALPEIAAQFTKTTTARRFSIA